jgi:hypothetical protein
LLSARATSTAAALAAALLVTACTIGGGDGSGGGAEPDDGATGGTPATSGGGPTPGSSPEPYLPVPDGIVLTDPGSELSFGEQATIAWRPSPGGEVGVLDVKVRKVVHAGIEALADWQLDAKGRHSSLYYVMVSVANVGEADLSGQRLPLFAFDPRGSLVASSRFKTDFDPCPSPALPEGLVTGEKATLCQAYLVPRRGEVTAVSFKPSRLFNAISWVGKITEPRRPSAG